MKENRRGEKGSESVAVLVSGGVDSCILLVEMAQRYASVIPLYIRNGLFWEEAELYWLKRFLNAVRHPSLRPLQILELPMADVYQNHWSLTGLAIPDHESAWTDVYLPGRNLILLSKAAVFCALNRIQAIALGSLVTNPFADSSSRFFSGLQRIIEQALNTRLDILIPFARRKKAVVLRLGRTLPLHLTFSCLSPQGYEHCGTCTKCAERIAAFAEAGLPDRTTYHRRVGVAKEAPVSWNGRRRAPARPRLAGRQG
jgi:7-cyano-7-deazaguanine synthase